MEKIFNKYKGLIDKKIIELAKEVTGIYLPLAEKITKSIQESAIRGKTVRGSLILLTLELFKKPINKQAVTVAAAIEYLHTALLIHDDIMDHDDKRRGFPSLPAEYRQIGNDLKVKDANDFGNSMAICIGDISLFAAFWFLTKANIQDEKTYRHLMNIIGQEFLRVGFGQAQDLAFAHDPKIPEPKEVKEMYLNKTARYTFSVPFMIGGILAKQNEKTIKSLENMGEALGLIYQLTDDALTLKGDAKNVGKAIGNDIKENKKTLYHVLLKKRANAKDALLISQIFGNKKAGPKEFEKIKKLIKNYRIEEEINEEINYGVKKAKSELAKLKLPAQAELIITLMIESLINREK